MKRIPKAARSRLRIRAGLDVSDPRAVVVLPPTAVIIASTGGRCTATHLPPDFAAMMPTRPVQPQRAKQPLRPWGNRAPTPEELEREMDRERDQGEPRGPPGD